ncbi:MAG: hypothetical protein N2379_10505 [Verrucomicrobiae bacterium]|nr:hypothetical protein [Verrucomicrobiae bacterium]
MNKQAKIVYPLELARQVGARYVGALQGFCTRIAVAGSVRRKRAYVGDVDIVIGTAAPGLLAAEHPATGVLAALDKLVETGQLRKRAANGRTVWGDRVRLAADAASGIPVDFYIVDEAVFPNQLFCRTGPRELNIYIASCARARGLCWDPFSPGFARPGKDGCVVVREENDVFKILELKPLEPELRDSWRNFYPALRSDAKEDGGNRRPARFLVRVIRAGQPSVCPPGKVFHPCAGDELYWYITPSIRVPKTDCEVIQNG